MVKRESIFQKLLIYLCLLLVLIVTMVPLAWIISASLKSNNQIFAYPIEWIPRHPKWSNYSTVWQKLPLLTYVRNSAKLTICVTLIQLFTCSFAAYGFAKCRFKGRDRLFILYIATMAIPWQSYMVAQYVMMSKLHLVNSHLSYILLKCFSPFGVFLMRQLPILQGYSRRAAGGRPDRRLERIRHLPPHHAAPVQACAGHADHFHRGQHMERLHGPLHLSDLQ